ncbi:MAG: response regulator transcription factor [Sedimentisphaerales bacterium]|nr:response regulator transcription factor [Sedimentisphaerales bacterium]
MRKWIILSRVAHNPRVPEHKTVDAFAVLTGLEREVLQVIAEGDTIKQVGPDLHTRPKTVEAYRLRITAKLEIDNIAQLTKYAIQEGLTHPEV